MSLLLLLQGGGQGPEAGRLSSHPALALQTVIVPGDKTSEGVLVEAVGVAWREIVRRFSANPEEMYRVPARKWEEIIAGSYEAEGWDEVILTPASNDKGRDVIAVKRGYGALRFIDQVKAYKPGHLVDANDVRALIGVLLSDHSATKGVVTTTSDFAPKIAEDPFIKPHMPYRLELIDGRSLVERLGKIEAGLPR